ncbi:RHS repeat-associated core domain-containing protein [Pseudomonas azerbaijanorientalis]|uniref:RHS repeat-associated core domain-containing protein n=1 Tax=Pseudomonas azerbaijanorientalis TaxID=2842350 RepID=UPI001C3C7422|nr:RHS domain-containing protein [Pseudomonas azerbaijanorientalis]
MFDPQKVLACPASGSLTQAHRFAASIDTIERTAPQNGPVSMVTGEVSLALTDGTLDGNLPFDFTRLYRSRTVELDNGLGFGWQHSLSQHLEFHGEQVLWIDAENRRTPFPWPTTARPLIRNRLSRATIYLGEEPGELILAQAGDAARFFHFRDGRLIAISDAYDNRLTVHRDDLERIQRLDNGADRALLLRYDLKHLVAVDYQVFQRCGPKAYTWRTEQTLANYRYDARQRLVEVTNAAGESERYDYDEQHVILQRQLAGGASFFWAWERSGKTARCVHHWASFAQMEARYVWDDQGTVTVNNANGSQEVYVHDPYARLVRHIGLDGGEQHKAYDNLGRLIFEQDTLGAVTQYHYDEARRLSALLAPDEAPTSYKYRHGFLHARTRAQATWSYQRNAQGDITAVTDPDGQTTHYSYDSLGRLLTIRFPDQSIHRFVWSVLGQLLEETLPDGSQRIFSYDALGRRITGQNEHGAITRYEWDSVGRLSRTTLPTGACRAWRYNAYGRITAETDELGRVTRYEYADDLHLISRRINPDGSALKYRYDHAQLLLTEIENEVGDTYRLDYTPGGLIRQETAFDGRRTTYSYDAKGQLLKKTEFGDEGSQLVTGYQRDSAGRLRVKTLPDGVRVEYRYDTLGRLVSVDDGRDSPLQFEYDLQDRLITEHQGWGTLRYDYDVCGRLKCLHLPDACILVYHHAKGGALTAIDLNGTPLTRHRIVGGREQQRQQGLLLSDYAYDEQGRLQAHVISQKQRPLCRREYAYSAKGNLLKVTDSRHGSRRYQYDALDRLTGVYHARNQCAEHFTHDPAGNLLIHERPGPCVFQGNRLQRSGSGNDGSYYDYDAFGNLIRERRGLPPLVTEYAYDSQHRLIGVSPPDGKIVSYRYDAFGRRVQKTVEGYTTQYFWQDDRLIAESGPRHYRSYIYECSEPGEPGSFRPLALLDGKGRAQACAYYFQLDHLGTPQELTGHGGAIVWSAKYTAHGKLRKSSREWLEQPLRFQGQYFDAESGLHYNRHRYYHPDFGRFLTPDPLRPGAGLNPYRYTRNPTGWVDPLGSGDPLGSIPSGSTQVPDILTAASK